MDEKKLKLFERVLRHQVMLNMLNHDIETTADHLEHLERQRIDIVAKLQEAEHEMYAHKSEMIQ